MAESEAAQVPSGPDHSQAETLQIRLQTRLPAGLQVTDTPIEVPNTLRKTGLNEIVNHLLSMSKPKEFEFVVEGELLKGSLKGLMKKKGISAERVLLVEYIEKAPEPENAEKIPTEEWVSCLASLPSGFLVSGGYDNVARIWSPTAEMVAALEGHTQAVKDVATVQEKGHSPKVITASKDHTLRMYALGEKKYSNTLVCRGHTGSVEACAFGPTPEKFASGSYDRNVMLWNTKTSPAPAEADTPQEKKRRKRDNAKRAIGPVATLAGHTDGITGLVWPLNDMLITSSMDQTIRVWDGVARKEVSVLTSSKAALCIDYSHLGGTVASGHGDNVIRTWDPRVSSGAVAKLAMTGHRGMVSGVSWAPDSPFKLASSSYDGTLRVWDIRASASLLTATQHEDKALACSWATPSKIYTGGADCKIVCHELSFPSLERTA